MLVALFILAVLGVWVYVTLRVDEIKRVSIPSIATPPPAGQPENILVVGSDSREGESAAAAQHFGTAAQSGGQRSDVIIILHINPSSEQASILSIPRDLYVPIAGTHRSDKINTAFNNGPDQLVQTIQQYFNIPVNHYMAVGFAGFQGIVDSVGGIDMSFPVPVRDQMSGLNITQTGCQHLNGGAALALARSRYYQYYANGGWQSDGTGDLGRIQRQHSFLRVLAEKAVSAGIHNPITANSLISSVVNDLTVDQSLSTADMVGLALGFRSLQPSAVPEYTVPTQPGNNGSGAVLFAVQPQTVQVVYQFLSTGTAQPPAGPTPSPSGVKVDVLNGSGVTGQASKAASDLRTAGFKVGTTGNAATYHYSQPVVLYAPGQQAAANLLESQVGGGAAIQVDDTLSGAQLTLVTGSTYTGIRAGANPAKPAPQAAPPPASYPSFDPVACNPT